MMGGEQKTPSRPMKQPPMLWGGNEDGVNVLVKLDDIAPTTWGSLLHRNLYAVANES